MNATTASPQKLDVNLVVLDLLPFHTALGLDVLWFASWIPSSVGATFGACIGLFFLAILHRSTLACLAVNKASETAKGNFNNIRVGKEFSDHGNIQYPLFSLRTELRTSLLEGLSSFVGYMLILAVVPMNTWFFISIIFGVIAGEIAFGRFKRCVLPPGVFTDGGESC